MAVKVLSFGWNNISPHDKIWGVVSNNQVYYSFWAKRNSVVSFKLFTIYPLSLQQKKEKSQYKFVNSKLLDKTDNAAELYAEQVWPGFLKSLENDLFIKKLGDNIK